MYIIYNLSGKVVDWGEWVEDRMLLTLHEPTPTHPTFTATFWSDRGVEALPCHSVGLVVREAHRLPFTIKHAYETCWKCGLRPRITIFKHDIKVKEFRTCLICYKRGLSNVAKEFS